MPQKVGVVGAGSIGSVLAKGVDALGNEVIINDTDPEKYHELPYEFWPKDRISRECDYAVFALPTPTNERTGGDASIVDSALENFSPDDDTTLILRSTMPPGSTRQLAEKHDLPLVYSPEFLRDRSDVHDFFDPDRQVFAGPEAERKKAIDLFTDKKIDCNTVIETDKYITAEIAKEAHNAFFATKVSFANQMRLLAERVGADPRTVMDIIVADSRNTASHLDPMLGAYGGKCLPKDIAALRHFGDTHNVDTSLLTAVETINDVADAEFDYLDIEGNFPNIEVKAPDTNTTLPKHGD